MCVCVCRRVFFGLSSSLDETSIKQLLNRDEATVYSTIFLYMLHSLNLPLSKQATNRCLPRLPDTFLKSQSMNWQWVMAPAYPPGTTYLGVGRATWTRAPGFDPSPNMSSTFNLQDCIEPCITTKSTLDLNKATCFSPPDGKTWSTLSSLEPLGPPKITVPRHLGLAFQLCQL